MNSSHYLAVLLIAIAVTSTVAKPRSHVRRSDDSEKERREFERISEKCREKHGIKDKVEEIMKSLFDQNCEEQKKINRERFCECILDEAKIIDRENNAFTCKGSTLATEKNDEEICDICISEDENRKDQTWGYRSAEFMTCGIKNAIKKQQGKEND